jgi:hypothetical protein
LLVENASSGVQQQQPAKVGRMAALGVARLIDEPLLAETRRDTVATTLDVVAIDALGEHRLERRPAATAA